MLTGSQLQLIFSEAIFIFFSAGVYSEVNKLQLDSRNGSEFGDVQFLQRHGKEANKKNCIQ